MRAQGPPWKMVVPGSIPVVQCLPASVEVAQPMLLAPPSKKRPVWKVPTIVLPNANESGSTCVLCWLDAFVYGSELIGVAITLAAETVETMVSPRRIAERRDLNTIPRWYFARRDLTRSV